MANKKTPITSVTPKSTVKPISKAQQAKTRKLIAGIASVTPAGRVAKIAVTASKVAKIARSTTKTINAHNKKMTALGKAAGWEKVSTTRKYTRTQGSANINIQRIGNKDVPLRARTTAEKNLNTYKSENAGRNSVKKVMSKKEHKAVLDKWAENHVEKELQKLISGQKNQSWKMRGR